MLRTTMAIFGLYIFAETYRCIITEPVSRTGAYDRHAAFSLLRVEAA
jgi:hypothetical protein